MRPVMKPLSKGWRDALCQRPRRAIGTAPALYAAEDMDWAALEYGRCPHCDGRTRDRIVLMGARG